MKVKFLLKVGLFVFFFFGEIAISFSDKAKTNTLLQEDHISFALKLANSDSNSKQSKSIDLLFESFLKNYNIHGASVAITKDEKLVYAKGFGMANNETTEEVLPGHLFRIASVSKLITAVTIMKLHEQGKLQLDEKVFGPSGILNTDQFSQYPDRRVEDITIRHLLNHTAGWSRSAGDPMFNSLFIARKMNMAPPADLNSIIEYTLQKKLNYSPGQTYSYSNLGYALLGKIIEVKTTVPYEDYVVMNILKPLGINDMHIGHSLYHQKFPNEVRYYEPAGASKCLAFDGSGNMVSKSYGGNNIELLAAAGGWVASAPELVKFMSAIDGFDKLSDILDKETLENMADPNEAGSGLYGWRGSDNYGTWWRTGTLSGSTALIMRMENGLNWVVLLNTSSYKRTRIHNKLSRTIFAATYRIKEWPDQDLFSVNDKLKPDPISSIPSINPEL
jgi:CubicO group peptidase (beta-lactamase class C family)